MVGNSVASKALYKPFVWIFDFCGQVEIYSLMNWFYSMMIMGIIFSFSKPTKKMKMEMKKMEIAIIPKFLNVKNMNSCENLVPRKFSRRERTKHYFLLRKMQRILSFSALFQSPNSLGQQQTLLCTGNNKEKCLENWLR